MSWDEDLRQLRRQLTAGVLFFLAVVGTGVVGYRVLAPPVTWFDSLYMTTITLTTVGYGEVIDLTGNTPARVFTIFLILVGMGAVLYMVSTGTAFILEGQLGHVFWRRKMEKLVARLSQHLIVCGSGGTAIYTAKEFTDTQRGVVVVCDDPTQSERLRSELPGTPILLGDPTSDEVLLKAGIDRAAGVVACAQSDKDNLIVTLTARSLNPRIRIVTRIADVAAQRKVRNAGADAVVAPTFIGGLRMASEMVRPAVVSFLDTMLRDRDANLRIEEVQIPGNSPMVFKTLEEMDLNRRSRALLLACRDAGGEWFYNPSRSHQITPGTVLVLMGSPGDLQAVCSGVGGKMIAPAVPASTE